MTTEDKSENEAKKSDYDCEKIIEDFVADISIIENNIATAPKQI